MGIREADADGIEHYYDPGCGRYGRYGREVFLIPCATCGSIIKMATYGRKHRYICERCRSSMKQKQEAVAQAWLDEIETKGEHRFNQALDRIQKQVRNFSKYERAAEIARTMQDKYGSVPEAMVAVELIRLGYSIIPQQKVGKYRVDFYIPKEKIVVEVDGALFHRDKFGGNREAEINLMLGLDTRIIHIPAELISKKIWKLKECIDVCMKQP